MQQNGWPAGNMGAGAGAGGLGDAWAWNDIATGSATSPHNGGGPPFAGMPGQQQAAMGDMQALYDMVGQGLLDQNQFEMLLKGGGAGQQQQLGRGPAPARAMYSQQGAAGMQMNNSMPSYPPTSSHGMGYPSAHSNASSSAQSPFNYNAPVHSPAHMHHSQPPGNPYAQPPYSAQQQVPPHQRVPSQPKQLPPHPSFPAYPSPPISAHIPLPPRPPVPSHALATHVANLDRISILSSQIGERETVLTTGAQGWDPASLSWLRTQLNGMRAEQDPLIAQCKAFTEMNGGREQVAMDVYAFKMQQQQQQGGGASRMPPPPPPHSRPPPATPSYAPPPPRSTPTPTLPFALPQSANARAFNNLSSTSAPSPAPAPTSTPVQAPPPPSYPSAPPPAPSLPPLPQLPTSNGRLNTPSHSSPPDLHNQPRPTPPGRARPAPSGRQASLSDSLPPGLRAQMAAARRAKSSNPPEAQGSPTVAVGTLDPHTPIMPMAVKPGGSKAGGDGAMGWNATTPSSRQVAPLPKSKDVRSATAILADPAPGIPTLAQLQNQLSIEKFNSILPVVLIKQGVTLEPRYTVGRGRHPVDLFDLYQKVTVVGHGGEKVTADGRWLSIAASLSLPTSGADDVSQELADLYHKVLLPFETVYSTALLAQRNRVSADKDKRRSEDAGLATSILASAPSTHGAPSHAAPPQLHAPQFDLGGAASGDQQDRNSAFRFGGGTFSHDPTTAMPLDMTNVSSAMYREGPSPTTQAEHERTRTTVRASGHVAPFTPPAPSASPKSWLGVGGGTGMSRSNSGASSVSRRSTGGRQDSGRFEELDGGVEGADEDMEAEGRRRKRTKSGEQRDAAGFALPTLPSTSTSFVADVNAPPLPLPPPQPTTTGNDHLFEQYLYTGSTHSPPLPNPASLPSGDLPSGADDPPSSALALDGYGVGFDSWNVGAGVAADDDLGAVLSKWDGGGVGGGGGGGGGLGDATFDFEKEMASWAAAGPNGAG